MLQGQSNFTASHPCSPYGGPSQEQLLASLEMAVQQVVEALRSMQPPPTCQISYAEAASGLFQLQQADFVYVRKGGVVPPLSPLYQGPYKVLDKKEKFFKIEVGCQPEVVSVDRLKPHLGMAPVTGSITSTKRTTQGIGRRCPPVQPLRPPRGGPLWRMKSPNEREENTATLLAAI